MRKGRNYDRIGKIQTSIRKTKEKKKLMKRKKEKVKRI